MLVAAFQFSGTARSFMINVSCGPQCQEVLCISKEVLSCFMISLGYITFTNQSSFGIFYPTKGFVLISKIIIWRGLSAESADLISGSENKNIV